MVNNLIKNIKDFWYGLKFYNEPIDSSRCEHFDVWIGDNSRGILRFWHCPKCDKYYRYYFSDDDTGPM
jgi:hypothetical protein